jgi:hypothetical protein
MRTGIHTSLENAIQAAVTGVSLTVLAILLASTDDVIE